jgi:hypothetical protein
MADLIVQDIQYSDRMDPRTMVRETNEVVRRLVGLLEVRLTAIELNLSILDLLATTESYTGIYRDNQTAEVFRAPVAITLGTIQIHAESVMNAELEIDGVPCVLDTPNPIAVTTTPTTYNFVSANQMAENSAFQVTYTGGTQDALLYMTIGFSIDALSG